jgi:hypothetical protein
MIKSNVPSKYSHLPIIFTRCNNTRASLVTFYNRVIQYWPTHEVVLQNDLARWRFSWTFARVSSSLVNLRSRLGVQHSIQYAKTLPFGKQKVIQRLFSSRRRRIEESEGPPQYAAMNESEKGWKREAMKQNRTRLDESMGFRRNGTSIAMICTMTWFSMILRYYTVSC